jgi:hypothetical protein
VKLKTRNIQGKREALHKPYKGPFEDINVLYPNVTINIEGKEKNIPRESPSTIFSICRTYLDPHPPFMTSLEYTSILLEQLATTTLIGTWSPPLTFLALKKRYK